MASLPNRLGQGLFRQVSFQSCFRSWVKNYAGKRYVPSIQFRYSRNADSKKGMTKDTKTPPTKAATTRSKSLAIEDWKIPRKYQRKRMSQTEMDYINAGGPP